LIAISALVLLIEELLEVVDVVEVVLLLVEAPAVAEALQVPLKVLQKVFGIRHFELKNQNEKSPSAKKEKMEKCHLRKKGREGKLKRRVRGRLCRASIDFRANVTLNENANVCDHVFWGRDRLAIASATESVTELAWETPSEIEACRTQT